MTERIGPHINISFTCHGCKFETSVYYRCQGDSGHDVYCNHPDFSERKFVADTRWDTPKWCPVRDIDKIKTLLTDLA